MKNAKGLFFAFLCLFIIFIYFSFDSRINYLKHEVRNLRKTVSLLESKSSESIILNTSSKSYSIVTSPTGMQFFVMIDNVKDYASGAEYSVKIVNPSSITLANIDFSMAYWNDSIDDYHERDMSKRLTTSTIDKLSPGFETRIKVRTEYKKEVINNVVIKIKEKAASWKSQNG